MSKTLHSDQRGGWFVQAEATGMVLEAGVPRAVTLGLYDTKAAAIQAHPDAVLGVDERGQTQRDRDRQSDQTKTQSAIASLAPQLAAGLRAQGWEGDGSTYHLHAAPGDAQALEDLMGRDSTLSERMDLERAIRAELTRQFEVAS